MPQGLIWLFLATIAEVPRLSVISLSYTFFLLTVILLKVFISLNLNSKFISSLARITSLILFEL